VGTLAEDVLAADTPVADILVAVGTSNSQAN
jgi:hypothetical protein